MQQKTRPRSAIPPKLHTIPRDNSEAAEQLELYKKVTKRQRILQELHSMEQRTQLLKQQLSILDSQIEETEQTIKILRQASLIPASSSPASAADPKARAAKQTASAPKTASAQKAASAPKSEDKSSQFETFYFDF